MPRRPTTRAVLIALVLATPAAAAPDVARGDYLVNRVALCGDCHTPRDAQHQKIAAKALTGAPFPDGPNIPQFAHYAPPIAGLPAGRSAAAVAVLLATGAYPDGQRLRPPMPQFRLNSADAEAVAAYLASLAPQP